MPRPVGDLALHCPFVCQCLYVSYIDLSTLSPLNSDRNFQAERFIKCQKSKCPQNPQNYVMQNSVLQFYNHGAV